MSERVPSLPWTPEVRDRDSAERTRFIESHVDLVRYVALHIRGRLPEGIDVDDLIHDGVVGLIDATDRYDPAREVRFRTYAERRVRGAILDGLRRKDWRPRSVRRLRRSLDEAIGSVTTALGRAATEDELADALGLELDEYRAALRDVNAGPLLSLDEQIVAETIESDVEERPDRALDRRELVESLADEIERLPERERRVLELYYHENLNMKEVGAVLGVTESRVCQLHAQAAGRLRVGLKVRLHATSETPARAGRR